MKTLLTICVFSLLASTAFGQLVITGVIDGPLPGGTPKAVEICAVMDGVDLTEYALGSANNGGGTDGEEFFFDSGVLNQGEFIYVATEDVEFANFFGFAPDFTTLAMSINGDDAVELFRNGVVVDVFGEIDVDGTGQPWEHLDGWAYRVDNTSDSAVFSVGDWYFSGINALDGELTNDTAAVPFPLRTYTFDPSVGTESVSLSAVKSLFE